jgi:REP element-mobilizing transposase RayT
MARKLRLEFVGACYHVLNRGNYRRDLFADLGAADSFEACLFESAERFGWRVHAFVIMRNHFHLAVELTEPNLSEGMRWLQATWAMRFNRFRGESGRPFQGRYKALHVEPGHALAQVAHYIHLNPVRAKVVTADVLMSHRWSSLRFFADRRIRPPCLEPATILAECGGLPDTAAGWRRYVQYLGVIAEEELQLRQARFGRLSKGWVIGSKQFQQDLKKDFSERGADLERFAVLGTDRTAQRAMREEVWEEKLVAAAKGLGIEMRKLPMQKSAVDKVRLAAAMKLSTSASNGWLAERLQMGRPASVSQFVRRLRLAGGTARPGIQRALSRVKP